MSSSSPDVKRCSWKNAKIDDALLSSNNPPETSNLSSATASNSLPDDAPRNLQNRANLPHHYHQQRNHQHPPTLTLNESPYSFDLPESFFASRFSGSRMAQNTTPMPSRRDSPDHPSGPNTTGTTPDSLRAEPAPLFSIDINRSSHLPSLFLPIHPISAPSPVSPHSYAINPADNNALFPSTPLSGSHLHQPKSNNVIFQSPHTNTTSTAAAATVVNTNHHIPLNRANPFSLQSQLAFGHRDELSTVNTPHSISAVPFERNHIRPRKRLSSSPDDVAQLGSAYAPVSNTPTLNLPKLVCHPSANTNRTNTVGSSFNTSKPLALLSKSNDRGAGPSRIGATGTNQATRGTGPWNQNRTTFAVPPVSLSMEEDFTTQDTIGVRYKTPVEDIPHVRAGIESGEANLSRSSALKSYLEETEKRIQKTPGLAGEMWSGPDKTRINVSVRYPRGEDDVDVLLDEATVLHSVWFTKLREGLTKQLEEIKLSAIQTEELMEQRLDAQRRFRSIPVEEVNKRMEYCRAKFLKCRLAVLEKYKTYVRALKWVHLSPKRIRRGSLTQTQNNVLRLWLFRHFADPYPTTAEKQRLMHECQMDDTQIGNWFINSRVRIWKPCLNAVSQSQAAKETVRELEKQRAERRAQRLGSKRRRVEETEHGGSGSKMRHVNSSVGTEIGAGGGSGVTGGMGMRPW